MFDVVIIYLSIATSFLNRTGKKKFGCLYQTIHLYPAEMGVQTMGANVSFLSASTGENHS